MKTALKRIFSFVMVVCMAVIGMVALPTVTANAADGAWTLVKDVSNLAAGDQVVIVAKDYDYALSTTQNKNNRGQAAVTKSGETVTFESTVQILTLENGTTSGTFAFNTGSGYLYAASSSSNYLRTETTLSANSSWKIEIADAGAATVKAQGNYTRNLMQYNQSSSLFACYTGATQKAICLYKLEGEDLPEEMKNALNEVNAYMSLAYRYTETTQEVQVPSEVTDTLDRAFTGITDTSYSSWSGKTATSSALYAGQSAGGNSSIQLRSNNSNSGIVTTASGGKAKKITVVWNSGTTSGRTLNVYGKNTAYTDATELYNTSTQGTSLGTIVNGTSTELTITGDYEYIGFRSASGALYLTSVEIVWDSGTGGGTTTETVLENSEFRIKCGVDESLTEIADVDGYGIRVTAGKKIVDYTTTAKSWTVEDGKAYVVINLGDIANELDKLKTEFTVQAYIKVGEDTYTSDKKKAYSVATMIAEYNELGYDVEHLYNYLQYLQEKEAA